MQIRLFSAYKKWKDEDSNLGRESNNTIEPKAHYVNGRSLVSIFKLHLRERVVGDRLKKNIVLQSACVDTASEVKEIRCAVCFSLEA